MGTAAHRGLFELVKAPRTNRGGTVDMSKHDSSNNDSPCGIQITRGWAASCVGYRLRSVRALCTAEVEVLQGERGLGWEGSVHCGMRGTAGRLTMRQTKHVHYPSKNVCRIHKAANKTSVILHQAANKSFTIDPSLSVRNPRPAAQRQKPTTFLFQFARRWTTSADRPSSRKRCDINHRKQCRRY